MGAPTNPMKVARVLVVERSDDDDRALLRYWRGQWMEYVGPHWQEAEKIAVDGWAYERMEHVFYRTEAADEERPWAPTRAKVADLLGAVATLVRLPGEVEVPSWIGRFAGDGRRVVACRNGLVDVATGDLHPATPDYFTQTAVPVDYDPAAVAPVEWLRFLDSVFPGDEASVRTLRMWFGYVLSGDTSLQKAMMLLGPPRAGKGTIVRVLEALCGRRNVAGPSMAAFATNFGLSPLTKATLATVGDARIGRGTDQAAVIERILSITGEDTMQVDRKNRDPWQGRIPARLMMLSNEVPGFVDSSGALASRFLFLTFKESFLGREDHGLEARLHGELGAILAWSLAGYRELLAAGRFPGDTGREIAEEFARVSSPVAHFLEEVCEVGNEDVVDKRVLFEAWRLWCADNGHQAGAAVGLTKKLRSVLPHLDADHRVGSAHDRGPRLYRGVRIAAGACYMRAEREVKSKWPDGAPA